MFSITRVMSIFLPVTKNYFQTEQFVHKVKSWIKKIIQSTTMRNHLRYWYSTANLLTSFSQWRLFQQNWFHSQIIWLDWCIHFRNRFDGYMELSRSTNIFAVIVTLHWNFYLSKLFFPPDSVWLILVINVPK